ncbi:hypothetical protein RI367_007443 [Sorochytrium milnesiophthora]
MRANVKPGLTVGPVGVKQLLRWAPTLALWGGVVGAGALYFAERVPLIRRDVYANLPVIGSRWQKMIEESESAD